jgi:hypothetical protein
VGLARSERGWRAANGVKRKKEKGIEGAVSVESRTYSISTIAGRRIKGDVDVDGDSDLPSRAARLVDDAPKPSPRDSPFADEGRNADLFGGRIA